MSKKPRDKKSNQHKSLNIKVRIGFKDLVLLQTGFDANPIPYVFKKDKCYFFNFKAALIHPALLDKTILKWKVYTFVAYENASNIKLDIWEYDYSPTCKSRIESDIAELLHSHIASVNRRIRINFGSIISLQSAEITKEEIFTLLNNTKGFWDTENKGRISTEYEQQQDSYNLMLALNSLVNKGNSNA